MSVHRIWIFLVLWGALPLLAAAQAPSFEARADARQVLLNTTFEVSFTIKNADPLDFKAPDFADFQVVSGPSRLMSTSIVNGVVSKELAFSYTLAPKRKGRLRIGAAIARTNSGTLTTQPLTVEVLGAADQNSSDQTEEAFLRAIPSSLSAWVGEQINLDYKLFTTVQIENLNILEEADYQGFFVQDVRRHDGQTMREVLGKTQYLTKVIKRMALFPQQSGELTIQPLQAQLAVSEADSPQSGFFFSRPVRRVPAATAPVTIRVKALPADAPPSFTGGVGRYTAEFGINRQQVSTDDALSVRIAVRGDGDIKRVQAPALGIEADFEVYDPKVVRESSSEADGLIIGEKVFEYLLVPLRAGTFSFAPAISFFHPDSARYVTRTSQLLTVTVSPGTGAPRREPAADAKETEPKELRGIKTGFALKRAKDSFLWSPLFWGLFILPLLALPLLVAIRQRRRKAANIDPAEARRQRARQMTLARMKTAEQHLKSGHSRAFYDETSKAMSGYICDKLQVPRSQLTKDKMRSELQTLQVPATLIDAFMEVVHTAEMALFAGQDNAESMQRIYDKSVSAISDIEAATEADRTKN